MTCLSIIRVFCSVFLQFLATLIGGLAVEWQKAVTAHQSPISDHPARHIWSPRCLCSCLHHISAGFTFFLKTQTTSHIISSAYGRNIMNGNKMSLIFLIDVFLINFMFKASQASVCFLEGFKNILVAYKTKHNEWLFLVQLYNINMGMLPYYCDSCTFKSRAPPVPSFQYSEFQSVLFSSSTACTPFHCHLLILVSRCD